MILMMILWFSSIFTEFLMMFHDLFTYLRVNTFIPRRHTLRENITLQYPPAIPPTQPIKYLAGTLGTLAEGNTPETKGKRRTEKPHGSAYASTLKRQRKQQLSTPNPAGSSAAAERECQNDCYWLGHRSVGFPLGWHPSQNEVEPEKEVKEQDEETDSGDLKDAMLERTDAQEIADGLFDEGSGDDWEEISDTLEVEPEKEVEAPDEKKEEEVEASSKEEAETEKEVKQDEEEEEEQTVEEDEKGFDAEEKVEEEVEPPMPVEPEEPGHNAEKKLDQDFKPEEAPTKTVRPKAQRRITCGARPIHPPTHPHYC
jgi:hypothetical protein